MRSILGGALGYFGSIFALGFLLGTARVLWLAPVMGDVGAVLAELPVMLAASWVAAGFWTDRLRTPPTSPARLGMGALALALLLLAEFGVSTLAFGRAPSEFLQTYGTTAGRLGLGGQIVFALIPWLRLQASAMRGRRS